MLQVWGIWMFEGEETVLYMLFCCHGVFVEHSPYLGDGNPGALLKGRAGTGISGSILRSCRVFGIRAVNQWLAGHPVRPSRPSVCSRSVIGV